MVSKYRRVLPSYIYIEKMCEYINIKAGKCNVDNGFCPFLFYCNKNNEYRVNPRMNNTCKKKPEVIPKNYYKVQFEKKKSLYIEVKNNIIVLKNPFDYVPVYVKLSKDRNGKWSIKGAL